jgi:hypothetical protein
MDLGLLVLRLVVGLLFAATLGAWLAVALGGLSFGPRRRVAVGS